MNYSLFIVLFILIRISYTASNTITNLNNCLNDVVFRYFSGKSVRVYQTEELCLEEREDGAKLPLNKTDCVKFPDGTLAGSTFELVTSGTETFTKTRNVIILARGKQWLEKVIAELKDTVYWDTKVLVVLFRRGMNVRKIFKEVWTKTRLINTIVMKMDLLGQFWFHSWYPYEKDHCENVSTVKRIEKWSSGGFRYGENLFPETLLMRNLNGCPLRAAAASTAFFSMFTGTPEDTSEGLDFLIVRELCRMYDMGLQYVFPPKGENHWIRFYPNGTLQGTMRMLYNNDADIGLSGYTMLPETLNILTFSNVYFIDPVVWFVPQFKQKWKSILTAFSLTLWAAVLLCIFVSTTFMHFLQAISGNSRSYFYNFMYVLSATLNQSVPMPKPSIAIRVFFICYVLYSLNMTTSYQSILYGILTAPMRDNPYDSLQAAFEGGLMIHMHPLHVKYYENDCLGEKIFKSKQFHETRNSTNVLINIAIKKTGALLQGNARMQYWMAKEYHDERGKPLVDVIPNPVTMDLISFHFSPNHPVKDLFDRTVFRLAQGGFINKWKTDMLTPEGFITDDSNDLASLSLGSLLSVFQLYGFGVCISCSFFLFEIFTPLVKGLLRKCATTNIPN